MVQWNRIALVDRNQDNRVLWTLDGEFSQETMMGLVAAGTTLVNEYETIHDELQRYAFVVGSYQLEEEFILEDFFDFAHLQGAPIETTKNTHGLPYGDKKRLWIWYATEANEEDQWVMIDLVRLDLFLQGFISMCNSFHVDFRDYILRPPIDGRGVEYDLPAYRVREYLAEVELDEDYTDED